MRDVDLLLTGGRVVARAHPSEVYDNGAVAVLGSKIVSAGTADDIGKQVKARRTIDCSGMVVMPGLVDLHVHACQQLSRGLADDVDVLTWLSRIVAFEAAMTEEDVYVSVKAACLEMIRGGTTAFVEGCFNPFYVDAAAQAVVDSGIRAVITRSTMEVQEADWATPDPFVMDAAANLQATREMIERWHGAAGGRLSAWAGWRQQWNLSDALLVDLVRLARDHGAGLAGHLSTRRYGQIDHLDRLGVLGPDMIFAHAIRYTAREVELIALNGVKIDHNPGASMHGGYGSAVAGQYPEMLARGVCVGLGCDGAANSNTLDMFNTVRLAATLHKEVRQDTSVIGAAEALRMGTENGATACQWNDIGFIAQGARADLIVVDLMRPHLMPIHDVISNLVYCASAQDVVLTMVDGNILMEDGMVTSVNALSLLSEVQSRAEAVAHRVREGV